MNKVAAGQSFLRGLSNREKAYLVELAIEIKLDGEVTKEIVDSEIEIRESVVSFVQLREDKSVMQITSVDKEYVLTLFVKEEFTAMDREIIREMAEITEKGIAKKYVLAITNGRENREFVCEYKGIRYIKIGREIIDRISPKNVKKEMVKKNMLYEVYTMRKGIFERDIDRRVIEFDRRYKGNKQNLG